MTFTLTITYDAEASPVSGALLTKLLTVIAPLHDAVGIRRLWLRPTETPSEWDYRWVAADGRVWRQLVRFSEPGSSDPPMTFAVPDAFRRTEFEHHREVRDLLIGEVSRGLLNCEVTFQ